MVHHITIRINIELGQSSEDNQQQLLEESYGQEVKLNKEIKSTETKSLKDMIGDILVLDKEHVAVTYSTILNNIIQYKAYLNQ